MAYGPPLAIVKKDLIPNHNIHTDITLLFQKALLNHTGAFTEYCILS